jgi:hypothetical protein
MMVVAKASRRRLMTTAPPLKTPLMAVDVDLLQLISKRRPLGRGMIH